MINKKEIYKVLKSFQTTDYYLEDFLDESVKEEMLMAFYANELVWIAENDRVLLTSFGEQSLFDYALAVEPNKKGSKL